MREQSTQRLPYDAFFGYFLVRTQESNIFRCTFVKSINDNLSHDTLTDLRIAAMAPFSSLDTWAWEMPREEATSIWVFPS